MTKNYGDRVRIWDLEEPLEGIKPIGDIWVYKRKKWIDEKVETYKARLVAKVYNQRPSFDYKKAFFG